MIVVAEGRALGGCGAKIRGWMCGWEAGEGDAAVVGSSWQSGDNQQPDLLCLATFSLSSSHVYTTI